MGIMTREHHEEVRDLLHTGDVSIYRQLTAD